MKRQLFRLLAVVCSLALVLTIIPLSVSAEDIALESDYVSSELTAESSKLDIVPILDENTSLREESTKYFRRADGTTTAAIYNRPIHYLQDGQWKDIDNTLISDGEENGVAYYTNQANAFKVRIPEKLNSSAPITVSHNGYTLTWSLLEGESNTTVVTPIHQPKEETRAITTIGTSGENSSTRVVNENKMQVHKQHSSVEYKNIQKGVHLSYDVIGNQLKESIILDKYQSNARYTFFVRTGGLIAALQEDNSVHFYDGKELVFIIASPYMLDANDELSQEITVQLKKVAEGYQYIITPSDTWLADKTRQYPVVIDPTVEVGGQQGGLQALQTYSRYSTLNYNTYPRMYAGSVIVSSTTYEYYSFIKFDMPSSNNTYRNRVLDAKLHLTYYPYYNDRSRGSQVNMHRVTDEWDASTLTWSNMPTYDPFIADYLIGSQGEGTTTLDITTLVNWWMNGDKDNYGVLLKNDTPHPSKNDTVCWYTDKADEATYGAVAPVVEITYRDCSGIEDYWDYTTVSAGSAGTATVNNYSGDLTFIAPLFTGTGERMPLSLSAVYNDYCRDWEFAASQNNNSQTSIARGWRLSVQQTLLPSSAYGLTGTAATDFPYVYNDADGTPHYFITASEDGTLMDEDGLGLTLTYTTSESTNAITSYVIANDQGDTLTFNAAGNLTQMADANGNAINIFYQAAATATEGNNQTDILAGQKIDYITDGVGRKYQLVYALASDNATSNYVSKIIDPAGREIQITRTATETLRFIDYPDGTRSTFDAWQAYPYFLLSATDTNDYQLSFSYSETIAPRIQYIDELSAADENGARSFGQKVFFDYRKDNMTVLKTAGKDNEYGDDDDLLTECRYDDMGRLVSQNLQLVSGEDYGAALQSFTDNETVELKQRNRITSEASLSKASNNYALNGNGENTQNWTLSIDDTTSAKSATSNGYFGKNALKLETTAVSTSGGCGDLRQNITELTGGNTYTLSAYVKIEGLETVLSTSNTGIYIAIRTINGTVKRGYSTRLREDTDSEINNGWRRLTATLTLPSDCTSVRVALAMRNVTGTVYFDGIQLEDGSEANEFNLLENGGFESNTNGMPTAWETTDFAYETDANGAVINGCDPYFYRDGSYSLCIAGTVNKDISLSQDVPISGSINDTYIFGGWAGGDPVNNQEYWSEFDIVISVGYKNAATQEEHVEKKGTAEFLQTVHGWQFAGFPFTLMPDPPDEEASVNELIPEFIRVELRYNRQVNYAYFDSLHLYKDVVQSYVYNDNGDLVSVAENAEQQSTMAYSGVDLTESIDTAGYAYNYTYDDNHNITKAVSARGVQTHFERNELGQVSYITIGNSTDTSQIKTESFYTGEPADESADSSDVTDAPRAYVSKTIDQLGNSTQYETDLLRGRTTSVTDANGVTTNYSYVSDNDDRLSSVSVGNSSVSYAYTGSRLSGLTYGGDTYTFSVDGFGNESAVSINNKNLVGYTYAQNNGELTGLTYGNGDTQQYTYNDLGQIASVSNGSSTQYSWQYDGSGENTSHIDHINGLKYTYVNDSIGRLIRENITGQNDEDGELVGALEYSYDVRNNLTKLTVDVGIYTTKQRYTYSAIDGLADTASYTQDNLLSRFYVFSNRHGTHTYDGFNRLTKTVFSTTQPLVTQYKYTQTNRGTNTLFETTQLNTEYLDTTAYRYSYDNVGNITGMDKATIAEPTSDTAAPGEFSDYRDYTYDSLSQLTSSVERFANGTVTTNYAYDAYGNILSKTIAKDGATTTIPYTYGTDSDAGWSKLLTAYNGQAIDYDAVGNPTTYLGATLDWSNGRQLTGYTKGDNTSTYTYDADGLRVTKTVNGTKHTYLYVDGLLMYEKRGDKELYFWYDGNGHLAAIRYYYNTDGDYVNLYALTNTMGDVLALYGGSGALLVTYEYDAWGNLVYINDTTALGSGTVNPIRYRGYYYDSDTGLYYCQSRYYDPQVGRFINADDFAVAAAQLMALTDKNLFGYCDNNPVSRVDFGGYLWETIFDAAGIIWSAWDLIKNPSWTNAGYLAWDIGATLVPVMPGSYTAKGVKLGTKAFSKIDDVGKAGKVASKIDDVGKGGKRVFNVTKSKSKIFKKFKTVKGKSYRTSGKGKKLKYYEWDFTHNDIEVYDSNKKHLGSMDPITGKMYKKAVKGRKLK